MRHSKSSFLARGDDFGSLERFELVGDLIFRQAQHADSTLRLHPSEYDEYREDVKEAVSDSEPIEPEREGTTAAFPGVGEGWRERPPPRGRATRSRWDSHRRAPTCLQAHQKRAMAETFQRALLPLRQEVKARVLRRSAVHVRVGARLYCETAREAQVGAHAANSIGGTQPSLDQISPKLRMAFPHV